MRTTLLERLNQLQHRHDARRVFRARRQRRHHRNGVVMGLEDDDLIPPLLDLLALAARHVFGQAGQHGDKVARLDPLPVHARYEIGPHFAALLGLAAQDLGVVALDPEAGDVDGDLEEFFGGFGPGDATVVVEQNRAGPQRPRLDEGVAGAEAHQRDGAVDLDPVELVQPAATQVNQMAADAVGRQ